VAFGLRGRLVIDGVRVFGAFLSEQIKGSAADLLGAAFESDHDSPGERSLLEPILPIAEVGIRGGHDRYCELSQ
jgi:hypothetical protein